MVVHGSKSVAWSAALLMLSSVVLLTSCKDREEAEESPAPSERIPLQPTEPTEPKAQDVRLQILPLLSDFPMVKLGDVQMASSHEEDGSVLVTARAIIQVEENLYKSEDAPLIFNEERKEINAAINRAMLPEAVYLLQAGAETSAITEEDRVAKPLPEQLKKMADEIKSLAEDSVHRLRVPAQTTVEIPVSMRARRSDGQWLFSDIGFDTAPLRSLLPLIPEKALPENATVVTDDFEMKRRTLLREKIEAFNSATKPYIEKREQETRSRMLEAQARREEAEKAEQEEAATRAERRKTWETMCEKLLYTAASYVGEWKRAEAFGKFTLRIAKAAAFPDALQFIGTLSDTDLPQAELRVVGRCEAPPKSGEAVSCVIHVYSGRYDPDVATAEVFDKKDGVMLLSLSEDGSLTGKLTCESWGDQPEKAFDVHLTLAPKKDSNHRAAKRRPAPRSQQPTPQAH